MEKERQEQVHAAGLSQQASASKPRAPHPAVNAEYNLGIPKKNVTCTSGTGPTWPRGPATAPAPVPQSGDCARCVEMPDAIKTSMKSLLFERLVQHEA